MPFEALNAEIRRIGHESVADRVVVVDLNIVTLRQSDFQDGFHLNDPAAQMVAEAWFRAVGPILSKVSGRS